MQPTNVKDQGMTDSQLDQLIRDLDAPRYEQLPVATIEAAREHREQMIPRLIESIQRATKMAEDGLNVEGNAHFFALFLLSEFRAKEALPAITDAILLPGELPFELFGDAITECLNRILAAFMEPPFEDIERIIAREEANEYVRSAAARTYLLLVRDGKLTREEAVERLRKHLQFAIENNFSLIVEFLVCELSEYSPHEAETEIRLAFERKLVDEFMISLSYVEDNLERGEACFQESLRRCPPTGIPDTIAELQHWASFQQDDETLHLPDLEELPVLFDDEVDDWDSASTIRNVQPRIGRNEPCPCGSGKKYKKCCGKK